MKEGKYFKKKEIDLTKISIFVLTKEGKLKLKVYIKKSMKVLSFIAVVLIVFFLVWGAQNSKFNKRKEVCDNLVSTSIWVEKETLRLKAVAEQKKANEKNGVVQSKDRDYLDFSPHSVTRKDKVLARQSIPECNEVYANGLEKK